MSHAVRLFAVAAPPALAQSRAEALVVLVEFGPNSMDIHGYQNPEMDKLIEAAHRESDAQKYAETVQAFTRIALTDVPKIPLMQPTQGVAMQKSVTGYQYWFHRQLELACCG